jgi:hypothetical protein
VNAAGDKQQPLALSIARICRNFAPQVLSKLVLVYFSNCFGFVQQCVGESLSALNYWGMTSSLMLGELFCYFPDIIFCTCIFNIFLKTSNPAVSSSGVYRFLRSCIALRSAAL